MGKFALVFILLAGSLHAAEGPGPSAQELYREAVASYQAGEFSRALGLFAQVRSERGDFRQVSSYINSCLAALRQEQASSSVRQSVEQAQRILDARGSVSAHFREQAQPWAVLESETPFRLALEPDALFEQGGVAMRPEAEPVMALVRDYIATHRSPFVTLTYQHPAASSTASDLNMRRAAILGLFFFRQFGVAWQNISVLSQPGYLSRFNVQVQSLPVPPPPGAQKVRGILVRPRDRMFDLDAGAPLILDVALMDPQHIREWSLRIWSEQEDAVVREFSGPAEVFVTLGWDGRNTAGGRVKPGPYQLLLSALNYAGERATDSDGFMVKASTSPALARDSWRPRPVNYDKPMAPRQWASVIRFAFNRSEVGGLNKLDIKQVARNLQAFPGRKVSVDGYADKKETAALALAQERAVNVAGILQRTYGISADRMQVKGTIPRQAAEGESLQKVIVYFSR